VRLIVTFLLTLPLALPARADIETPENAMRAFYSWVLAHPSISLPSPKERTQLSKILSPELVQLLKEASDTEARCIKVARKGDKPDILEGNLFVGNYEGATEVAYGKPDRDGEVVFAESDLLYIDSRFPKAHKHRAVAWKDRLELRLAGTRWLVQDIKFQQGNSLAAELKEYIAEGARSCLKP
jgi:hypothetical protein